MRAMSRLPTKSFESDDIRKFEEYVRKSCIRPEGAFVFYLKSFALLDCGEPEVVILNKVLAGGHIFHMTYLNCSLLRFYYVSPGTGTRVAEVNPKGVSPSSRVTITVSWSPNELRLTFSAAEGKDSFLGLGVKAPVQFRAGKDGQVYVLGSVLEGRSAEILQPWVYKGNQLVVEPTAIELWRETLRAVELLLSGQSEKGYSYEIAIANSILSILVTGFEAYTKRRFVELENEGISPSTRRLTEGFFSKQERKAGLIRDFEQSALANGKTVLAHLVGEGKINFQSYSKCKCAYGKAYSLHFGNIGLDSEVLAPLQKYIKYRHRIVHVSPLILALGTPTGSEGLVASSKELALEARNCFNSFIENLHRATLKLRP